MKLLGSYTNGNYHVRVYNDGTKVRESNDSFFKPNFPESIDLKITNMCDRACPMCYENSTIDGHHADFNTLCNIADQLHPYTEVAIGGGNPLSYPRLEEFLIYLKERNIITNITVNELHFIREFPRLKQWSELGYIYGIGVSTNKPEPELLRLASKLPNVVFHTILGLISFFDLFKLSHNKVLLLGYKDNGRGLNYKNNNRSVSLRSFQVDMLIEDIIKEFNCICFDNLAIQQLSLKDKISPELWDFIYMGNDGEYSLYIDAVNKRIAKNSISREYAPLEMGIDKYFTLGG